MPGGARISICALAAATSISISRSSSSPSRSFLRNFCRATESVRRFRFALQARAARRRQQHVQHAVLGGIHRPVAHAAHGRLAAVLDGDLDQVAHDGIHVAADIADLGELRRLDLDEGRVGEPRQTTRDLRLADAGGADHEDVLRRDLGAQRLGHLRRGASGCAGRWRRRAWRAPGRRCACPARGRFPAGSWRTWSGVRSEGFGVRRPRRERFLLPLTPHPHSRTSITWLWLV